MISRVKQQLRGSDLHNSAANTPRGRLTFAASKLGLPSANPRPHRLTSRFAPPRNGPGSLLFPPALKVIPRRLPPHDLSLRYHPTPTPSNGANDAVEGWQVSPPGRRINQSPPSPSPRISSKRFHEIVSNPFVLFHCSLLVVSLSICGRRAKLRQLSPTLTAGPFPPFFDIILYIYNVCATRVNLISRDSSQFARHTASNFAWDSSPGVAPYFLSKRPCALPIMTSPGWVLLKILTLDPPDTTRPLSLSLSRRGKNRFSR